ncbi:MAG: cysteine--tRNA ligase [Saprospiraceae bacterium]|nr:cysteine--tRNA ligase [Saprospiraceae bacterium]
MPKDLYVHNSLTREKSLFVPLHAGHVGMYVCGPTVYNDVHLGNCRSFVSFDIIFRTLRYLGYKVRYVRNITDVGHLLDDGEDRIAKGARLEQLEPMEIVEKYTNGFHDIMRILNVLPPSIEPRATGHIIEQIEMVKAILESGLAYEINGSVYFDTVKFSKEQGVYGQLSGRIIEDLLQETRDLNKQDEKRHPADFAIWMKAEPEHIMRWNSPWGEGFPGWHLECSAMSTKYLGKTFDIHGGGSDLKFPHHENEIAQNYGACGCAPARYWLHGNMLLLNGKKMSKSDGNTISPYELFTGESEWITKGYGPMVVRFFMLQAHYRSTLDITDGALQAAEKGFSRLMETWKTLHNLPQATGKVDGELDLEIRSNLDAAMDDLCDDFNTPRVLARFFEIAPRINALKGGQITLEQVRQETLDLVKKQMAELLFDVFGLKEEADQAASGITDKLMSLILDIRMEARLGKDWPMADKIRDGLKAAGIVVKDGNEGSSWGRE